MKNTVNSINSEFNLIEKIKQLTEKNSLLPKHLTTGIGDDCAVFKIDNKRSGLLTSDQSIENVHFSISNISPEDIGYKAMMSNLSDVAAMCGTPKYALISIGIPDYIDSKFISILYKGMINAANKANTAIVGGDTSKASELYISITVYGETSNFPPTLRSNATAGQTIYLTGNTGCSMAGLKILQSGNLEHIKQFKNLVSQHCKPEARFALTDFIQKKYQPASMIDISDGLISDLGHIINKSKCGFTLIKESLPLSKDLEKYSDLIKKNPYDYILNSGEEYELLFTSSVIKEEIEFKGVSITPIGIITDKGMKLSSNGKAVNIKIRGFDHFK